MALKSMKLTAEQRSEEVVDMKDPKPPVYPWGLTLQIEDETMQLLGVESMEIGTAVEIRALARVVSGSQYEREGKDGAAEKDECMSVQITDMDLTQARTQADPAKLYPSMKAS
jgi:hypothetical protein